MSVNCSFLAEVCTHCASIVAPSHPLSLQDLEAQFARLDLWSARIQAYDVRPSWIYFLLPFCLIVCHELARYPVVVQRMFRVFKRNWQNWFLNHDVWLFTGGLLLFSFFLHCATENLLYQAQSQENQNIQFCKEAIQKQVRTETDLFLADLQRVVHGSQEQSCVKHLTSAYWVPVANLWLRLATWLSHLFLFLWCILFTYFRRDSIGLYRWVQTHRKWRDAYVSPFLSCMALCGFMMYWGPAHLDEMFYKQILLDCKDLVYYYLESEKKLHSYPLNHEEWCRERFPWPASWIVAVGMGSAVFLVVCLRYVLVICENPPLPSVSEYLASRIRVQERKVTTKIRTTLLQLPDYRIPHAVIDLVQKYI